ncbi:uncharacterized protein N7498_009139 [Penicillium cinerascens]|uniref:Uncharacterized protein n=1 Tax=Penicillium cinerascens TaxID=70096 RepID=A0A9W9J3Y2_9EURO|nr:uncharacterized protein N7498_009139 [Penicillium cinerascens]KAJ5190154.1 hypothetical protein N7498_009139 [Penicillium cinerascens]
MAVAGQRMWTTVSQPTLCNKDPSREEGQINDIGDVQTSKETRRPTHMRQPEMRGGNDAVQVTRGVQMRENTTPTESD